MFNSNPPQKKIWSKWLIRAAVIILLIPLIGIPLWIWGALTYTYSSGERVGFVQKLSNRGWICKTYEGELAQVSLPGQPAEIFEFTVRDKNVADAINKLAGHKLSLQYEQHKGLPTSCFGDTEYFVTAVRQAD